MKSFLSTLMVTLFLTVLWNPAVESCPGGNCDPAKCAKMHEERGHGHKCPGARADQAAETDNLVVDPICGMKINKEEAAAEVEYEGRTYYFCRLEGKEAFLADPAKYLMER
ncbi:MAG: YHS domain-containing protein [bacterium]|nr:YHS domain-containing protein [bacterium]